MKKNRYNILYKDQDLIVLEKPAGLLSIPDRYDPTLPNVLGSLKNGNDEVFTLHRLDRDTSGVMVFALNAETHRSLSIDFERHKIKKLYYALVQGRIDFDTKEINLNIIEDKRKKGKMLVADKGKESITILKRQEVFRDVSLVSLELITGRTHQIRVQMQHLGYPLLVDAKYGGKSSFLLSSLKGKRYKRKEMEERPLMSRTSLHAYELNFKHPSTKEDMSFRSELPKDFKAVLNQLRKFS